MFKDKTETTSMNINKVVRIGLTRPEYTKRGYHVYCRITFTNGELSISGVEGPLPSRHARGGYGQISSTIRNYGFKFAPGWNSATLNWFLDIWDRWHLNDMRAECEHQRAMGWTYGEHRGEACPTCGYHIGSSWLREDVPEFVINFLAELPDTDRKPAWV